VSSINQHSFRPGQEDREIFLLFELEEMMYAIDCEKIIEIAPLVTLKALSDKGASFAGFFNYRGQVVSVIDLCRLLTGRPCRMRLSTRIILTEYTSHDGESYISGLMTEGVTEIIRKERKAFLSSNIGASPYISGIMMENGKIIQYIDIKTLPDRINVMALVKDADISETS
jgi:chemotaxis-related protein WspB